MNLVLDPAEGRHGLYLGNIEAAHSVNTLRQKDIKAVLTAAEYSGVKYSKGEGITHLIIPADDIPSYNMARHFERGIKFIREQLAQGCVLVHCFAGISRSSTLVLAYLIREHRVSLVRGIDMLRSRRPIVCPNIGKELKRRREAEQPKEDKLEIVALQPPTQTKKGLHPNLLHSPETAPEPKSRTLGKYKPGSFSRSGSINARLLWRPK
ncbi:uncharacterized protein LOC127595005 [Hippocampus zosterae]|uniref:uncharacterized protein LOC127595005 n=1 Tax=Hippocampus zosterae TaxID=109293 RepID=UPI00223CF64C|nr:uncharacterized protein LOC127595005 [Hippocampus zosterae]